MTDSPLAFILFSAVTLVAVLLGLMHLFIPPIMVVGESMEPTYHDSDIVFGIRFFRKRLLKKGDVIVLKHPETRGRLIIKRVHDIFEKEGKPYSVFVLGDNADNSFDSRSFGYVTVDRIVAKVVNGKERVM